MSVQSDLATAAKCYCFDPKTADQVLVYLLAKKANLLSVSPSQLAVSAKCFCFDDATYRGVVAYLWESISNNGETPTQLVAASKCFCFDDATQRGVVVYLLNSIAGSSVSATSLPGLAKCYCFNRGTQKEVVAYLLETISGLNQTPAQLAIAAKCFCFDEGVYKGEVTYLLNSINSPPGPPPIHNITAGLVNWWKFDENAGITASDSADAATGTLTITDVSLPIWVPGQINSALRFDDGSYVQLATNSSAGTGAFTISAWVKNFGWGTIFYDSDNDNSAGFWLTSNSTDGIVFQIVGSSLDLFVKGGAIPIGVWTYVLCTWGGDITSSLDAHIFINAVEVSPYSSVQDGSGTHGANTTNQRNIGFGLGFGALTSFNFGSIDDVRIWNRVLSQSEITNMFQWRGQP